MITTLSAPTSSHQSDHSILSDRVSIIEELYNKYCPILFSIISNIIPDTTAAKDTLVQVFLYVHHHLPHNNTVERTNNIWLLNVARDIAVDNLCKMQNDYQCDKNFKTLSLAEKTVFALFYFRSFSVSKIVELLHLPAGTVTRLLESAERKAKNQL